MAGPVPNADLLSSLGRLMRGLSALFWGLPIALVVCVQSARGEWLRPLGIAPPVLVTALLCYGVDLLGHFQKQERIWRAALDRTRLFALINLGLSPFLYWWNKIPSELFYNTMIDLMTVTALMFLLALNPMLHRLTAMLPDETLRAETKLFSMLNRWLLYGIVGVLAVYFVAVRFNPMFLEQVLESALRSLSLPQSGGALLVLLDRGGLWIVLILVLLPVAMTMALIWKIKEVILASVFGPEH